MKRTINGLEKIKKNKSLSLKSPPGLNQRQEINFVAKKMSKDSHPFDERYCPRAFGLSDPFTREKKKGNPKGANVCMMIQLCSGCEGCWKSALRERYPITDY